MLEGVDISYAQANYQPGGESFIVVNASRANIGLATGSWYHRQVDTARAHGKEVGHYFFNGNISPSVCANYFVDNLYDLRAQDVLVLDVESEGGTNTAAWTPAQALEFARVVFARTGKKVGIYLNQSLMNGSDWSSVVAFGCWLWIAYYNPYPPVIRWWPDWTMWQYTSTPIDRNRSKLPVSHIAGTGAVKPIIPEQEDEDVNGFYVQVSSSQPKYWFSPSTGKVRRISTAEWEFLRAVESTRTTGDTVDVKLPIVNVSADWLGKALKLHG